MSDLMEIMLEASLATILTSHNPETGRPFTHKETAEALTRISEQAPHLIERQIARFQAKIDLLTDYLPKEASHDHRA